MTATIDAEDDNTKDKKPLAIRDKPIQAVVSIIFFSFVVYVFIEHSDTVVSLWERAKNIISFAQKMP